MAAATVSGGSAPPSAAPDAPALGATPANATAGELAETMRHRRDEYATSLKHLLRSQGELAAALTDSPDDEDFRLAIEENKRVIEKRKAQIRELDAKIKEAEEVARMVLAMSDDERVAVALEMDEAHAAPDRAPGVAVTTDADAGAGGTGSDGDADTAAATPAAPSSEGGSESKGAEGGVFL